MVGVSDSSQPHEVDYATPTLNSMMYAMLTVATDGDRKWKSRIEGFSIEGNNSDIPFLRRHRYSSVCQATFQI